MTKIVRFPNQENSSLLGHIVAPGTYCFPYFEGFKKISTPVDQKEACIAQDVLSCMDSEWEKRTECLKNLHLLAKRYPQIGDLWALLVIAYRMLGRKGRFRKILLKGRRRFPMNKALLLLAYLEGIETAPKIFPFSLETLPEIYIWGLTLMFHALGEGDLKKALNLYSEMVCNTEDEEELSHWALTQGAFALSMFKEEMLYDI
jgi:hypothetical protein